MKRIQKGDEVIVIAGKKGNKGARGTVLAVMGEKVLIQGVNQVAKHVKPNPQLGIEGGIVRKEAPIHVSNVMLFNPKTGKGDKVSFKVEGDVKYRVFRSTGEKVN